MQKSKLKRRLRKKLHVGEFREFGFEVSINFKRDLDGTEFDEFIDKLIDEIEKNKLLIGGGGRDKHWTGFVTSQKNHSSPTEKQRAEIKDWLEKYPEIAKSEVGNFIDAWYDEKWKD